MQCVLLSRREATARTLARVLISVGGGGGGGVGGGVASRVVASNRVHGATKEVRQWYGGGGPPLLADWVVRPAQASSNHSEYP
jgi:hypothetical protein